MIRVAINSDAPRIYDLLKLYSENVQNNILYIENDIMNNNYSKYFLYEEDNYIIGVINIHDFNDYIEIIDIVVDKYYRNNGIGTKLLQYVVSKKNDCNITLEVKHNNYPAINLYKKLGFEIVNERKKYYKDADAYIMLKRQ